MNNDVKYCKLCDFEAEWRGPDGLLLCSICHDAYVMGQANPEKGFAPCEVLDNEGREVKGNG